MRDYKIAILSSGKSRGSNFEAIATYLEEKQLPVQIEGLIVTSNKALIIEKAKAHNIPWFYFSSKNMVAYEESLLDWLQLHPIDLIVLAGFMRPLSKSFLVAVVKPILNIHPALLPLYGGKGMFGIHVHEAVFSAKEKVSGATIHLVNECYDEGQILRQEQIDITTCQSAGEIAQRVLSVEHHIYGQTIWEYLQTL